MPNSISLTDKKTKNLNFLPNEPGIYKFLDSENEVIYIGKAKNLRKRVKSYISSSKNQSRIYFLRDNSYQFRTRSSFIRTTFNKRNKT